MIQQAKKTYDLKCILTPPIFKGQLVYNGNITCTDSLGHEWKVTPAFSIIPDQMLFEIAIKCIESIKEESKLNEEK
jgi:hypothetical protein